MALWHSLISIYGQKDNVTAFAILQKLFNGNWICILEHSYSNVFYFNLETINWIYCQNTWCITWNKTFLFHLEKIFVWTLTVLYTHYLNMDLMRHRKVLFFILKYLQVCWNKVYPIFIHRQAILASILKHFVRSMGKCWTNKAGIQVHFKGHNTIQTLLMAPKDKDNMCQKSGVIYHSKCSHKSCPEQYIGEFDFWW